MLPIFIQAYPCQITKITGGVQIQRGFLTFRIMGENAHSAIETTIKYSKKKTLTENLIEELQPVSRDETTELISALLDRNILFEPKLIDAGMDNLTSLETHEDVFYWHFDLSKPEKETSLNKIKLLIVGLNTLSLQLIKSLNISGVKNISLLDDSQSSEKKFTAENDNFKLITTYEFNCNKLNFDCVITCSYEKNSKNLLQWNQTCRENNLAFYPIKIDNIYAFLGPYIIPKVTACYQCLINRENSNSNFSNLDSNINDTETINGFHPMMIHIAAGIAALELTKIFTKIFTDNIGKLIEINFIKQKTQAIKIFRIPYCQCCAEKSQ